MDSLDELYASMGLDFGSPRRPRRPRAPAPPPVTPEEERTLLSTAVGGLGWIGDMLDKPGAAVRGLFAGQPEQLLNLIPFSDTLGITDENGFFADSLNAIKKDDRVTGRELLEQYLGAPKNQPGLFNSVEDALWDVGGFAAEVATDPLTLLTLGSGSALTAAGRKAAGVAGKAFQGLDKAADAATALKGAKDVFLAGMKEGAPAARMGVTAAQRADEIRKGLRGIASLKVPFMEKPLAVLGSGKEWAAKLVEHWNYGPVSPVVPIRYLFSKVVGGMPPGPAGWGAAQMSRDKIFSEFQNLMGLAKDARSVAIERMPELTKLWKDVGQHARTMGDNEGFKAFDEFARHIAEETKNWGRAPEDMKAHILSLVDQGHVADMEPLAEATGAFVDTMLTIKDRAYSEVERLGGNAGWLHDMFVDHVTRMKSGSGKYIPSARKGFLTGLPGGTLTVQRASRDARFAGTNALSAADKADLAATLVAELGLDPKTKLAEAQAVGLWRKYFEPRLQEATTKGMAPNDIALAEQRLFQGLPAGAEWGGKKLAEDEGPILPELVKWLNGLPPEVKEKGVFDRSFMDDWADHLEYCATTASNLRSVHAMFKQGATTEAKDGFLSLRQAWNGIDENVNGYKKGPVTNPKGRRTFVEEFLARTEQENPQEFQKLVDGLDPTGGDKFLDAVANRIYVDPRTPQVAARYLEVANPKVQTLFGKIYDGFTRIWKTGSTTPWPAFNVRNWVDNTTRTWLRMGPDTYTPKALAQAQAEVLAAMRPGGSFENIENFQLAKELGVLQSGHYSDWIGKEVGGLDKVHHDPITATLKGFGEGWAEEGSKAKRLLRAGLKPGENAFKNIEMMGRFVPFRAALLSGKSPSQAAALATEILYDYGKLPGGSMSSFGDTMKKVFPFWGFMRENVPYQIKQIFEHPGGGHAQTIRLIGNLHKESGEYQPDWLKERMAIRLGGTDDKAQLMSSFGLSIEDLSRFAMRNNVPDTRRIVDRVVSELNPMLGLPISLWTQREPYSGRDMKDLEPFTGLGSTADAVVYSLPTQRLVTTLRQLMDERKGYGAKAVNALTGVKISTHDLEKAKIRELEKANRKVIEDDPLTRTISMPWLPAEDRAKAGPSTLRALERSKRLRALAKQLRERRERELLAQ